MMNPINFKRKASRVILTLLLITIAVGIPFKHETINIKKEGLDAAHQSESLHEIISASSSTNITFDEVYLWSNMVVNQKHVLVGYIYQYQMRRINLETKKMESFKYNLPQSDVQFSPYKIADLKNGDIAIGMKENLIIVDNQTMQMKQLLRPNGWQNAVADIYIYNDFTTKQTTYYVGRHRYNIVYNQLIKGDDGKYYEKQAFVSNQYIMYDIQFQMTSQNTGASLVRCQVTHWQNLKQFVDLSQDSKYYLKNRQFAAVSNNQKFFVVRTLAGSYEFYSLDQNYDVNLLTSYLISIKELQKGAMTSDDENLFVYITNLGDQNNVAKFNIKNRSDKFVGEQDGTKNQQKDFHLFEASQNKVITLTQKEKSYYLQLRAVDSLKLLSETLIYLDFPTIFEYKLVGTYDWGLTFGLAVRISPYYSDLQIDSKILLFKVDGVNIVNLNISTGVSFGYLKVTSKYIITHKDYLDKIKLFHASNLTFAAEIDKTKDEYLYRFSGLNIQNNIMIIKNSGMNRIFNLSESLQSKGAYYDYPYTYQDYLSLIFEKRGIIYYLNNKYQGVYTKIIYDISKPTASSYENFMDPQEVQCMPPVFKPLKTKSECRQIFFLQNNYQDYSISPWFTRYDQCSKTYQKYPLDVQLTQQPIGRMYVSTDKKYLIILLRQYQVGDKLVIEVRPFDSLEQVVYHAVHKVNGTQLIYPRYGKIMEGYNVDFVSDLTIVLHTPISVSLIYPDFKKGKEITSNQAHMLSTNNLVQEQ